jgi:hypothetical protein
MENFMKSERQQLKEFILEELPKETQEKYKLNEENQMIIWFIKLSMDKKKEIYYQNDTI